MKNIESRRYAWSDSVKGIAICGVVMIHSGGASMPGILGVLGDAGKYGVQLFFLLSGFLAYSSLNNFYTRQDISISPQHVYTWWLKKIIKLAPLYYIAVIVALLVEGTGGRYWLGSYEKVSFLNIVAHFLFLHGINPYYINSIIGGEWYLAVLVLFFLLAPCLYKYINSLKRAGALFVFSAVAGYCLNRVMLGIVPVMDEYIWGEYIKVFWMPTQLPVLVLGIILYFLVNDKNSIIIKKQGNRKLSYSILICGLIMTVAQLYEIHALFKVSRFITWALCFFIIIISQVIYESVVINNVIFKSIGRLSYPIYLFHLRLITIFEKYIQKGKEYGIGMWLMKYFIIMLGAYLIAYMLERFVDIPINKHIRKRFNL
ncbi:acyltransferase [Lachnospiraceae bacterium 54-11]